MSRRIRKISPLFMLLVLLFGSWRLLAQGANLPTVEEFSALLTGCAAGAEIEVDADLLGSITSLYRGERTEGAASFRTSTRFLELIPEKDRLKAYELFTTCITKFVNTEVSQKKLQPTSLKTSVRCDRSGSPGWAYRENYNGEVFTSRFRLRNDNDFVAENVQLDVFATGGGIMSVQGGINTRISFEHVYPFPEAAKATDDSGLVGISSQGRILIDRIRPRQVAEIEIAHPKRPTAIRVDLLADLLEGELSFYCRCPSDEGAAPCKPQ